MTDLEALRRDLAADPDKRIRPICWGSAGSGVHMKTSESGRPRAWCGADLGGISAGKADWVSLITCKRCRRALGLDARGGEGS